MAFGVPIESVFSPQRLSVDTLKPGLDTRLQMDEYTGGPHYGPFSIMLATSGCPSYPPIRWAFLPTRRGVSSTSLSRQRRQASRTWKTRLPLVQLIARASH